jgi:hypothetical protein
MPILAQTFQWKVLKQPKKERALLFLETLGGPYDYAEKRMVGFESLCNGSLISYALKPCSIFTMLGSSMRFISFSMYLNHK